jgi:hypothetical protein
MNKIKGRKHNKNSVRKKMNIRQDSTPFAESIENCNKLTVAFDSTIIKDHLFNAKIMAFINYCKSSKFGIIIDNEAGISGDCIEKKERKIITSEWYKNNKKLILCFAKNMFKLSLICHWHKTPDVFLMRSIHAFLCDGNNSFSYGGY